jgi:hypothetical protein
MVEASGRTADRYGWLKGAESVMLSMFSASYSIRASVIASFDICG